MGFAEEKRLILSPPTSRVRCRLKDSHKEAIERFFPYVGISVEGYIYFEETFKRKAQVHIEIGFGNGEFLYNLASRNPDINFVGIEFSYTGISRLLRRMTGYGTIEHPLPANLRIIRGDARLIVPEKILDESVDRFYILFPDPWPKRRHHKRRLINPAFAFILYKKLKEGGQIVIATDHEDYALQIEESVKKAGFSSINLMAYIGESLIKKNEIQDLDFLKEDILSTKYARKAIAKERKIFIYYSENTS